MINHANRLCLAAMCGAVAGAPAQGNIGLELRPASSTVLLGGGPVGLGLYAVSDSGSNQLTAALQAIIQWDPAKLDLLGISGAGAVPLLASGFPANDPYGLNESVPPQDGVGLYVAFAQLGSPAAATPQGTLITTFLFQPVAPTPGTPVDFIETAGSPPTDTVVFDGTVPNLDVTGELTGAIVRIVCCPADLDGDCNVGIVDFLGLLEAWGTNPGGPPDLDGNGTVDVVDFLALLQAWGPCP